MAKKWYPVIDFSVCMECGGCVDSCVHGVYRKEQYPTQVMVDKEICVTYCHVCGNACPVGAITYVGDDTGWTPPAWNEVLEEQPPACACSCSCYIEKKLF